MFPRISVSRDDTVTSVEARLAKAIMNNARQPGIKPIYTPQAVREEASRLLAENPEQVSQTV